MSESEIDVVGEGSNVGEAFQSILSVSETCC